VAAEPAVSVIIPARDAAETIAGALGGLSRQDLRLPFEVIVVDDASTDETAAIVKRSSLDARLLRGDGSGAGGARNIGAAAAEAPLLAFTDADCAPQPGWLRAGLAALSNGADLVQGAVEPDPTARMRPFDRTVRVTEERGFYETANLLVRRDLFERLGGFEDWLIKQPETRRTSTAETQRPIGEDMLFAWRARRSGARTTFSPEAVVHHAVFPRGPLGYLREQLRLRHFPAIAKRIPETRRSLFFARFFLNRRRAAFDLAAAATLGSLLAGYPILLVGMLPYLYLAVAQALRSGPKWAPIVLLVGVAADSIALLALTWGSFRHRALLL
jgi:glycosyltransferase involved in cell wall biosynthesis